MLAQKPEICARRGKAYSIVNFLTAGEDGEREEAPREGVPQPAVASLQRDI
jgi:hypothetical protein